MFSGQVILGDPGADLRFKAWSDSKAVGPGGHLSEGIGISAEAHSDSESEFTLQIISIGAGVAMEKDLDGPTKIEIETPEKGIYYARIWPKEEITTMLLRGIAISNAIWID